MNKYLTRLLAPLALSSLCVGISSAAEDHSMVNDTEKLYPALLNVPVGCSVAVGEQGPGTYVLDHNKYCSNSGAVITITSSDVVLDLNGFGIYCTESDYPGTIGDETNAVLSSGTIGIYIQGTDANQNPIKNVKIRGARGNGRTAVIDGCTIGIEAGTANYSEPQLKGGDDLVEGAGYYSVEKVSVRNCLAGMRSHTDGNVFKNNSASCFDQGSNIKTITAGFVMGIKALDFSQDDNSKCDDHDGGTYNNNALPSIRDNLFHDNFAADNNYGFVGGNQNDPDSSDPLDTSNVFYNNTAIDNNSDDSYDDGYYETAPPLNAGFVNMGSGHKYEANTANENPNGVLHNLVNPNCGPLQGVSTKIIDNKADHNSNWGIASNSKLIDDSGNTQNATAEFIKNNAKENDEYNLYEVLGDCSNGLSESSMLNTWFGNKGESRYNILCTEN